MAVAGARRRALLPGAGAALLTMSAALLSVRGVVHTFTGAAAPLVVQRQVLLSRVSRYAEDSTKTGALALARLETDLEAEIKNAQDSEDPDRLKNLARLLVLAKTAEGIAVKEGATDLSSATQEAIAQALAGFVGKEDYDFEDVTAEVQKRTDVVKEQVSAAVEKLDDIYFEDIAREMDLAGQAAVAQFTGKEEYKFGDISKEVASRATSAVATFTGKEDYQFGDISKEAMKRGKEWVKDFTGQEEYKFGDLTKAAFSKLFGDDSKK